MKTDLTACIAEDAVRMFIRDLNLPAHGSYTREQHVYMKALRENADKRLPVIQLERGIEGHAYVVIPRVGESRVLAVREDMLYDMTVGREVDFEPDRDHPQYAMFAEEDLYCVRVLTSWVNSFTAFSTSE